MHPSPFTDITYLKEGTPRQQQAWEVLTTHLVLDILQNFDPILTGTIPLDIDIESSDLDIVCHWQDAELFTRTLRQHWGHLPDFQLHAFNKKGYDTILAQFSLPGFALEIFGQNRPGHQQEAYRHMVREYAILQKRGPAFKAQIRELKRNGLKTEPAFAQLLGLTGDPYMALLDDEPED
jgi:hypothetical protein